MFTTTTTDDVYVLVFSLACTLTDSLNILSAPRS